MELVTIPAERMKYEIDRNQFEKLVNFGFNIDAICFFFDCDKKYIDEFCKNEYNEIYDDLILEIESVSPKRRKSGKEYIVYMHISPSRKKYIGITKCSLSKRWRNGKGYWSNEYFSNAIKKYGWENFEHAILYSGVSKEDAEHIEKELIKKFNTTDRKYGYNIEGGGCLNKEVSKETRRKLSENATGVKPSEETRLKMPESHKGEKCHFYGIKCSDEHKKKLYELKRVPVACFRESGELVEVFPSMKEAAKHFGITRQAITASISGRSKLSCGYIWRKYYAESRETRKEDRKV